MSSRMIRGTNVVIIGTLADKIPLLHFHENNNKDYMILACIQSAFHVHKKQVSQKNWLEN